MSLGKLTKELIEQIIASVLVNLVCDIVRHCKDIREPITTKELTDAMIRVGKKLLEGEMV